MKYRRLRIADVSNNFAKKASYIEIKNNMLYCLLQCFPTFFYGLQPFFEFYVACDPLSVLISVDKDLKNVKKKCYATP